MNPRRFWGKDMAQALGLVRNALGPDALILETKSVDRGHGGGVEITALVDNPISDEPTMSEGGSQALPATNPIDEVRQELATLKSMICWLAPRFGQPDKVVSALLAQGLAPETIARLSDEMKESPGLENREKLHVAIRRLIPSGGQIREEGDRLALLGPSGVGKTSSLIKLTVFETQRRGCRVGWINTDQRSLASGDPLAIYAGILGVRYETASTKAEIKRALARLSNCDVVLLDTPAVNPRDEAAIKEMNRLFHGLTNVRRALLLSAVTNERDMVDWIANFQGIAVDSLFFTKLDECRDVASIMNTALKTGCPLSYLTLGQNLAGDLAVANPEVLASLLLTGVKVYE